MKVSIAEMVSAFDTPFLWPRYVRKLLFGVLCLEKEIRTHDTPSLRGCFCLDMISVFSTEAVIREPGVLRTQSEPFVGR